MSMFVLTLLVLSVCCVGCTMAKAEPFRWAGKIKKENSSDPDIQHPPLVKQRHAKLEDVKAKLGKVNKEDTNSSGTDFQHPPLVKELDNKLASKVNHVKVFGKAATTVEEIDAKLADLRLKHQKFAKKNTMRDMDIQRLGEVIDFLRNGLQSVEQLEAMADAMYCFNGESASESESVQVSRDCDDAFKSGQTSPGVYTVSPDGVQQFDVYCEDGWTVIQRRMDGSVDFYLGWADYKQGFGSAEGEYWLGNDNIYLLTANGGKLRVEMEYGSESAYAEYSGFSVGDESQNYRLSVTGYSGTAGDSLDYHNGQDFSTKDQDNDNGYNCAQTYTGAWWYNGCYQSNLNGDYNGQGTKGVMWYHWKSYSLTSVKMMVKPN